jgi:hypothetical protein
MLVHLCRLHSSLFTYDFKDVNLVRIKGKWGSQREKEIISTYSYFAPWVFLQTLWSVIVSSNAISNRRLETTKTRSICHKT